VSPIEYYLDEKVEFYSIRSFYLFIFSCIMTDIQDQELKIANNHYNNQNYRKAIELYESLAKKDNCEAMYELATIYTDGLV